MSHLTRLILHWFYTTVEKLKEWHSTLHSLLTAMSRNKC